MIKFIKQLFNKQLLTAFVMGISSGLPLLITITLMQAWAKEISISKKYIGLMALIGLPYTLKFVWAPLFDRFELPFLGRRRGWLLISQVALFLSIIFMGSTDPSAGSFGVIIFVFSAFLITFFSASQDVIIDAFRREDLVENQLGIGSSYYVYGYRIGMLIVSGGGMILASQTSWQNVFICMALCMIPGILTTLFCKEPKNPETPPKTFKESVIEPFLDYFKKTGAVWILVFILLYKIGDTMAAALSTTFYLEVGFTKMEIGTIAKLFGFWGTMGGAFLGGAIILRIGINKALWVFGFFQMISTAGFALLAKAGDSISILASVVTFENVSSGMGTAAFMGFMASITNKKFTATQYALLTSLMGVPRVFISSSTGFIVETMGWYYFFILCTIIAIPGLLMLSRFAPWNDSIETKV